MSRQLAVLFSALAVVGCGAPASAPASAPADQGRVVRIEMKELAFAPPQILVTAGETITLVLTNAGALEHEFMAGTGVIKGKGYSQDWLAKAKVDKSGGHDMGHAGEGVRVAPGKSATIKLVVPSQAGQVEFGCFVEGHYEGGMRGLIVVAGGAPAASATPAASAAPSTDHTAPSPTPNPTEDHAGAH